MNGGCSFHKAKICVEGPVVTIRRKSEVRESSQIFTRYISEVAIGKLVSKSQINSRIHD